jgi:hypothetical protein
MSGTGSLERVVVCAKVKVLKETAESSKYLYTAYRHQQDTNFLSQKYETCREVFKAKRYMF